MAGSIKSLFERAANALGTEPGAAGPAATRAGSPTRGIPGFERIEDAPSTRSPPARRRQRQRGREVLEGCMEPLWTGAEPRLTGLRQATLDALTLLHGMAAARRWETQQSESMMSQSFHASLRSEFNATCREFLSTSHDDAPSASFSSLDGELELVGYGEIELAARIESAAARIRNATDETFAQMTRRLVAVVGEREISSGENPLRPSIFCRAYCHVLEAGGVREADLPSVLGSCEVALVKVAAAAYEAVDRYLDGAGYSGEILLTAGATYSTRMRGPDSAIAPSQGGSSPGAPARGAGGGPSRSRGPSVEQILQSLYERMQLLPLAAPGGVPAGGAVAAGSAGAGPVALPGGGDLGATLSMAAGWPAAVPGAGLPAGAGLPVQGLAGGALVAPAPGAGAAPQVAPAALTAAALVRGAWGGTPMTVAAGVPLVSLEQIADGADLSALARGEPPPAPAPAPAAPVRVVPAIPGNGLIAMAAAPVDPALIEALNRVQKMSALAVVAGPSARYGQIVSKQAEEIRAELLEHAQRQVDKLTIEIVGMLFDRIAQDKHLPDVIKELLRELQFPMMKVALVDPELFTKPEHPSRQLMDRIASTSVGWTPEGEDNERYYAEVRKAIYAVLSESEDGPGAFERALEAFEKFLAEERTRDDDPVTRAKKALAEAETREIMAINAMIRIRTAFEGVQVESYLREFLLNTWSRVLAAVWHKDKGDEKRMRRFLDAVPDLVWSVQPKISQEDRRRLITSIPSALAIVREGLTLIELPEDEQQQFFSRLMNSHAQAVKALELAHGIGVPQFERDEMRGKLEGITLAAKLPVDNDAVVVEVPPNIARSALVSAHVASDVDVLAGTRIEPQASTPPFVPTGYGEGPESRTDVEIDVEVRRWRRGDWFDLALDGHAERVRLRWISPQRSFYLFQPPDGGRAHSLPLDVLRQYVRRGTLRLVGQAPLFERLVNGLMADLRHARPDAAAADATADAASPPPDLPAPGDDGTGLPAAH